MSERAAIADPPLLQEVTSAATAETPKPEANLDWQAYFKEFCLAHGNNPIMFGGVLLFEDGWTYSAHDHSGPEWSPPKDVEELHQLMLAYWQRRRAIVQHEAKQLAQHIHHLEELQQSRKVPLQQVIAWFDSEAKRWHKETGPLDLEGMRGRLQWLDDDVQMCEEKVKEFER